jgi:hypothetical protein
MRKQTPKTTQKEMTAFVKENRKTLGASILQGLIFNKPCAGRRSPGIFGAWKHAGVSQTTGANSSKKHGRHML